MICFLIDYGVRRLSTNTNARLSSFSMKLWQMLLVCVGVAIVDGAKAQELDVDQYMGYQDWTPVGQQVIDVSRFFIFLDI